MATAIVVVGCAISSKRIALDKGATGHNSVEPDFAMRQFDKVLSSISAKYCGSTQGSPAVSPDAIKTGYDRQLTTISLRRPQQSGNAVASICSEKCATGQRPGLTP